MLLSVVCAHFAGQTDIVRGPVRLCRWKQLKGWAHEGTDMQGNASALCLELDFSDVPLNMKPLMC